MFQLSVAESVASGLFGYLRKKSAYEKRLAEVLPQPLDREVDSWLQEGLADLLRQSQQSLGLAESEARTEPLLIRGAILWQTNGISSGDVVWKRGNDGAVRFGVYRVTIIHLTERHLGAYSCDYNFIKNVPLNEGTKEYHYRDVVSVSTGEESSSLTLPSGEKLTTAQEFKISVASGEAINVTVDARQIREMTGVDRLPETGAEKAVSTIRAMLREKKA